MATKRIKDISTTATTFAADDFIALDASSVGTRKMAKASLITQVGANYLEKADNLSDVADKDTSKLNLEVPNVGTAANEVSVNGMLGDLAFQSSAGVVVDDLTVDGHFTGTVGKPMPVNGPSMRFDGVDDYVEFAAPVGSAFSFTNGTDDLPFTLSGWVKMTDATQFCLISKWGTSIYDEWAFYVNPSDKLDLTISNQSVFSTLASDATLTAYEGQWIHISCTYGGAGPNSSNSFANALSGGNAVLYVNGKAVASTATNNASYTGMVSGADPVRIGRYSQTEANGEIRDVKLYNKELSPAEVKEVYSNGQLLDSFAESTGAITYTSDFSAGVDGFTAVSPGTLAGNIDSIGGQNDNLRLTVDSVSQPYYLRNSPLTAGKRYSVTFDYYIPSTNSNVDGLEWWGGTSAVVEEIHSPTLDTWGRASGEFTPNNTTVYIYVTDGGSRTINDAGGDDVLYIRNVRITQIGSVLDARAENYNQSAGKLLDVSGNDFVGTQSGGVELLTPRSHLSAGTLDLTNLPTSATGLSAGEVYNDSGTLKIV
jgi:hypothetical protein